MTASVVKTIKSLEVVEPILLVHFGAQQYSSTVSVRLVLGKIQTLAFFIGLNFIGFTIKCVNFCKAGCASPLTGSMGGLLLCSAVFPAPYRSLWTD